MEWCLSGPERGSAGDAFVTYGLGACWAPLGNIKTVATDGWNSPCQCFYGDRGLTNFGNHRLGDVEKKCPSNHKFAQRFALTKPGRVTSISVDLKGVSTVKGALYIDDGGRPGPRIAATIDVGSKATREWVSMKFENPVDLNGGSYWIAFLTNQDVSCYGYQGKGDVSTQSFSLADFMTQKGHTAETEIVITPESFVQDKGERVHSWGKPSDPFDPVNELVTQAGGLALYASYTPNMDLAEVYRTTKVPCETISSCSDCLAAVDSRDGTDCMMVLDDRHYPGGAGFEPCHSTKWVQANGATEDQACQEQWGMQMFSKMERWECKGDQGVGPNGQIKQKTQRPEECAQLCYKANAHFEDYEGGTMDTGDAYYCEGFSFNNNIRECTLYHKVYPEAASSGKNCYVSKELANLCSFPRGSWVRTGTYEVFYVADSVGSIFSADHAQVCDGMDVWGDKPLPSLYCDGTKDPSCSMCISKLQKHNKYMGPFSCDVFQHKKARICQFESQVLNCPQGAQLSVASAFYGRAGQDYCSVPTISGLVIGRDCGTADNIVDIVKAKCNGKNLCEIEAVDATYGDQDCASIYKYVEVTYRCETSETNL